MSEENLEIVRRSTEAYNRGDIAGTLESWASDAVLDWSNSHSFEAGVIRGRGEIQAYMERFLGGFEEVQLEVADLVEVKKGIVIAENVAHVRGRDGIEAQARSAWLIEIRNGQQTSLTLFQTMQEALQAAGQSEL